MPDIPNSSEAPRPDPVEAPKPAHKAEPKVSIPEAGTASSASLATSDGYRSEEQADGVRTEINAERDPYEHSVLMRKISELRAAGKQVRIAFIDLDSTFTGNQADALESRRLMDEQGIITVAISSRTSEMMMSRTEYEKSKNKYGYSRPEPHIAKVDGKNVEGFADEVDGWGGLYDFDVIVGTTGTEVLLRQDGGGYIKDQDYASKMKDSPQDWRRKTDEVLKLLDPDGKMFVKKTIESLGKYESGEVDVAPPDFREQLDFNEIPSNESTGASEMAGGTIEGYPARVAQFNQFQEKLRALADNPDIPQELRDHIRNIKITNDSNPEKNNVSAYLTPNKGSKQRALDYVLQEASQGQQVDEAIYFGDSYPDLPAGLYGGFRAKERTLVLVNGSRLHEPLTNPEADNFAGTGVKAIKERLSIARRFRIPLFGNNRKTEVVMGAEKYPDTKVVGTVKSYLQERAA